MREKFFTVCIRRGAACEIHELDFEEENRLKAKYGVESELVVWINRP